MARFLLWLTASMNSIWLVVDRLLAPSLRNGTAERRQQGRLVAVFGFSLLTAGFIYLPIYVALGSLSLAMVNVAAMLVAIASLIVLRTNGSTRAAGHLLVFALLSDLVAMANATGGSLSPAVTWFTLIPAVAVLLIGLRAAVVWTALTTALFVGFVIADVGGPSPSVFSDRAQWLYSLSNPFTLLPLHFAFVALFHAARARMLHEVEGARAVAASALGRARLILDSVNQGLLMVDRDGRIQSGTSGSVVRWFGEPPPGQTLWEWVDRLDPSAGIWLRVGWDQLVADFLPPEVVLDQLKREFTVARRQYELSLKLVESPEQQQWSQVLVVITDVTEARAAALADASTRELLAVLGHLARDRMGFLRFLEEQRTLVERLERPGLGATETLRAVHTLKGNASLFGLSEFASHCHALETTLQDEARALTPMEAQRLSATYRATTLRMESVIGPANTLTISSAEVNDLARAIALQQPHATLAMVVRRWTWDSLGLRLHQYAEQSAALCKRLGKGELQVTVEHGDLFEAPGAFSGFWSAFSHVIRNAIDHGIEAPEVRQQLGKGAPRLALSTELVDGALVVRVRDDGAGINWERVRQKAQAAGLPHDSRADLEAALWSDGISTADAVTDISGRGVGLAAVLTTTTAVGGRASIDSQPGRGTEMTFRLPCAGKVERLSLASLQPGLQRIA